MDPRLNRTQFAARAATLADQFQHAVEPFKVGGHHGEMTAPEASTGGGVQSLQHIRLVPNVVAPGARTYVVGNANRLGRVAELRSLAQLDRLSIERFGAPTGFDPKAYASFLEGAGQFLEMFGLTVTYAALEELEPGPNARSTGPVPGETDRPVTRTTLVIWSLLMLAIGAMLVVLGARYGWIRLG